MKVTELEIPGVLLFQPKIHGDARGFFFESFHAGRYAEAGLKQPFVQDNLSRSGRGTLRGMHFQEPCAQGKLVQALVGAVYDVVIDIRKGSPTFGRWVGCELTEDNRHQLWVPPGFAHGFCVLSETADFFYKCTEFYAPQHEGSVRWDDPDVGIRWPISEPKLSAKDAQAPLLRDAPLLPGY